MPPRRLACLAGVRQLFLGIGSGGFQQAPAAARCVALQPKQGLGHQAGDAVSGGPCRAANDRRRRVQREAPGEHRQPPQHDPFGVWQQVMAPVQRRAQRLVARQRRPATASQQGKAIVKTCQDMFDPQRNRPCGSKFDRQRHAVEPSANRANHLKRLVPRVDIGAQSPGTGQKKLHRATLRRFNKSCRRHRQRGGPVSILAIDSQRLAAG